MLQQEIWLLTSIKFPFQVEFPRLHEKIEFSQYPLFEIGVGHASLLPGDVLNLTGSHNSHVFLPPSIKPQSFGREWEACDIYKVFADG